MRYINSRFTYLLTYQGAGHLLPSPHFELFLVITAECAVSTRYVTIVNRLATPSSCATGFPAFCACPEIH